jgi:UDP-N-acetylglucosamine acyltransferase
VAIHPTAIVHPSAQIGGDVEIGAYAIMGEDVVIGDGTIIHPHVMIYPHTRLGKRNEVFFGAALGGLPQDRKFKGERSYLTIGDGNQIREFVTLHRATGEDRATVIGSDNLLMAYAHLGHNCVVGSGVMMANAAMVGGHSKIDDRAVIGAMVGLHQFMRVGELAMIGGYSRVVQDVPPFMMAEGRPSQVVGINAVGLRRAHVPDAVRSDLKTAHRLLYRSDLNLSQALERIRAEVNSSREITVLVDFLSHIKDGRVGRQLDRPT